MTKDNPVKLKLGQVVAIIALIFTILGAVGGIAKYVTDTINNNILMVNDNVKEIKQDVRIVNNKMDRHLEYHIDNNLCAEDKTKEVSYAKRQSVAKEEKGTK